MSDSRKLDASQRQELAWLLDEADAAVQAWWQSEQEQWPGILSKLVSRLRLCGFEFVADSIDDEVQASPKLGRNGCRNRRELLQLRQQVVDRVRKRIIAIREAVADKPPKPDYISQQLERIEAGVATIAKSNRRRGPVDEAKAKKKEVEKDLVTAWEKFRDEKCGTKEDFLKQDTKADKLIRQYFRDEMKQKKLDVLKMLMRIIERNRS
jgi:hypothetical protein